MAYQLAAWIQCKSQSQAELIRQLLDRDTRPCFAEDVPLQQLSLFELLYEVEFPAESEVYEDRLWLFWYEVENFGFNELTVLLNRVNLTALFVFEVIDYPMSGDSDEDEVSGRFWKYEQGHYNKVSRKIISDKFPENIVERLP